MLAEEEATRIIAALTIAVGLFWFVSFSMTKVRSLQL